MSKTFKIHIPRPKCQCGDIFDCKECSKRYNRRRNSINKATQRLPQDVKEEIRKLWAVANVMDLNYSSLAQYLGVIRQQFERTAKENAHRKAELQKIAAAAVNAETFHL